MRPKKIHYIWVGFAQKPEIVEKCIESWKKHLPDYEICEWNNEALKNIDIPYVKEAFQCKKWAFVSDYLRLKALYEEGGLYFDTDLEVTNNLDTFLHLDFFSGYEDYEGNAEQAYPITALMAAEPKSPIIKDLLDEYNHEKFILDNGDLNVKTNTKRITEYFKRKFNLTDTLDSSKELELTENCKIYPYYYFSTPKENKINYSIHHFDGSWHDNFKRRTIMKLFGQSST